MLYSRQAFSLVELAIVLVILGLLVGGILAGRSLIRASELRAIPQELNRYNTAIHAFRDRYFGLPGDITNATKFWGTDANCPGDFSTPSTGSATCDGSGNGRIEGNTETFRAWQHLANAGLIKGQYTGVNGHASLTNFGIAGQNIPTSKASSDCGYGIFYVGPRDSSATGFFEGNYGNPLRFGAGQGIDGGNGRLLGHEAWNVDTKMDDGMPGKGKLRVGPFNSRPECSDGNDAATAGYQLTSTVRQCHLLYIIGY